MTEKEERERERERTVDTKHELILDSTRDIKNPKSKHQKGTGLITATSHGRSSFSASGVQPVVSSQDPARPASRLLCLPWYMEDMLLHILCTAAAGSRTCMPPLPTSPPLSMDPNPSHVPNQPGGFSHCGMDPRLHIGVVYYAVYVCIPAVEAVAQYL